jgi:branched-chain amino acid transport system permease protein
LAILTVQILNSLLYASVLFLIAAGLSLIFGVMRIVNLAHGSLYAVGAYVTAWLVGRGIALHIPLGWLFLLVLAGAAAVALIGIVIEPLLLRPFYRRAEEYQLLVTFGLIQILEDLMRLVWGGTPLSADTLMDALPIIRLGGLLYPGYNLVVIGVGVVAAVILWAVIYHTKFGVMLRATSQDRRMASALGLNVGLVYVSAFGIGSLKGALVGAVVVSFVRTAGIQFFPELELAVLYLIAALVLLVRPTGLFGTA